jgi:DNA invertase Pin-like site-specific DNA recombinase
MIVQLNPSIFILFSPSSPRICTSSTENQPITLREYCSKQGWEIAGEYVDHESEGHSRRSHFQEMYVDARAREFDLVLFWSLDRLSREGVSAILKHLETLTSYVN